MQNQTTVSTAVQEQAEAALAWINQSEGSSFELTGLVDVDETAPGGAEVGLVLCDGEICLREQVRILGNGQFEWIEAGAREIPPLLDPPEGMRRDWLAGVLARHKFVVLLFYRGLW